jgi:uncharacterized membrane protein YagU involved in acid resistance
MNHRLISRIVLGAVAGISGTVAMTIVMKRLHRRLPAPVRYSLPPREIVQEMFPASGSTLRPLTTLAHFGYGAASGVVFNLLAPRRGTVAGMSYGLGVWLASYLGWIPAVGLLKPATRHPRERNLLMIAAHLAWGAVMARTA